MEVKVTGHSHSAESTLHYIFYGSYKTGKGAYNLAHTNPNGVRDRNELLYGINCHRSYRGAINDFNHYLRQKPHNKVQTLNIILSSDKKDFNFDNKEDCFEASEIASKFVSRAFPDHQAIVALQHDNKNDIPHIHLIMNAISMRPPYKTINGKYYGIGRLRSIGAICVNDYEKQFQRRISSITRHIGNGYQKPNRYQKVVINALDKVITNLQVNSPSKLRNALKPYGIRASFKRRGTRRKRKRKLNKGRRYQRNGLAFKYVTKQNGKKRNHYCRASRLADVNPKYSYKNIIRQLADNKAVLHKQHTEAKARKTNQVHLARVRTLHKLHQRAIKTRRVRQEQVRQRLIQQRKEQTNHERRRLSKQASKQLTEMAKKHRQNATPAKPVPRPIFQINTQPTRRNQSDSAKSQQFTKQQRRINGRRQEHYSKLRIFFSNFRRESHYFRKVYLRAKIYKLKRHIAKAIHRRIEQIRGRVQQRIKALQRAITRRNSQRKAEKHRRNYKRWQRQQGGPEL